MLRPDQLISCTLPQRYQPIKENNLFNTSIIKMTFCNIRL